MKASTGWSCCSLSRKFRPLKYVFGARRFSARSWRRSKRDASQPSTKARGRPSKIQAKSNSMDHGQLRPGARPPPPGGNRGPPPAGGGGGGTGGRGGGGGGVGGRHQRGTMPNTPTASPAEKAASTTSTSGARHWVPKKKCTVAS